MHTQIDATGMHVKRPVVSPNCQRSYSADVIAVAVSAHLESARSRTLHADGRILIVSGQSETRVLLSMEEWILDPMIWSLVCGDDPEESAQLKPALTLILGNTYPVRAELAAVGGRWDSKARGWWVPDDHSAEALALVKKAGPKARRRHHRRRREGGPAKERLFVDVSAQIGEVIVDSNGSYRVIRIESRNVYADSATGWKPMPVRVARLLSSRSSKTA